MDIVKEFNLTMSECEEISHECVGSAVNLKCAANILADVRQDGLSKRRVQDLAMFGFDILDDETPLAMFTTEPSPIGLDKLMLASGESVVAKVALAPFRLIAKIISKLTEWSIKAVKWVWSKITDTKVTPETVKKTKALSAVNPTDFLRHLSPADQKSLLTALSKVNIALGKHEDFEANPSETIVLVTETIKAVDDAVTFMGALKDGSKASEATDKIQTIADKANYVMKQVSLSDKVPSRWSLETSSKWVEEVKAWKDDATEELSDVDTDGATDEKGVSVIKSILTLLSAEADVFNDNKQAASNLKKLVSLQESLNKNTTSSLAAVDKAIRSNTLGSEKEISKALLELRSVLSVTTMVIITSTRFITSMISVNEALMVSPNVTTILDLQDKQMANKTDKKAFEVVDIDEFFKGDD